MMLYGSEVATIPPHFINDQRLGVRHLGVSISFVFFHLFLLFASFEIYSEWLKKVNNRGKIKRRYVFVKAEIDSKVRILLDIEENLDESSDFSFDEEEDEELV